MKKCFKVGCVRLAEYVLISRFSVWGTLCVWYIPCGQVGTPCYLGNEFPNSIWSWNTLFTLLLGRSAEFAQFMPM